VESNGGSPGVGGMDRIGDIIDGTAFWKTLRRAHMFQQAAGSYLKFLYTDASLNILIGSSHVTKAFGEAAHSRTLSDENLETI
jgi:hypothetical protein